MKGDNMDKYTKFILTTIALCLIGINFQLFKNDIISTAHAIESHTHSSFEIFGLDLSDHSHDARDINNIEDHEHYMTAHPHITQQIAVNIEGHKEKMLDKLLIEMLNKSHTHFWN